MLASVLMVMAAVGQLLSFPVTVLNGNFMHIPAIHAIYVPRDL